MPTTLVPPESERDDSDQCVGGLADERDVDHPTITNAEIEGGRPLANVVSCPVSGSTREILPAKPSVT